MSRMDAAVDAMSTFGFPEKKVKKQVRLLLKVYGGDDGWRFIEEYSYKELLDAMLRDVEQEQEMETLKSKDKSDLGTSTGDEGPRDNSSPVNTAHTQPESSGTNNDQNTSGMSTLQPANTLSPGGQLPPIYGEIERDDVAVQLANSLSPGGTTTRPWKVYTQVYTRRGKGQTTRP